MRKQQWNEANFERRAGVLIHRCGYVPSFAGHFATQSWEYLPPEVQLRLENQAAVEEMCL